MKVRTRVVLQLAALCVLLGAYSFAANDAYLYIVHGIPGRDVAAGANPGFPIDVLINGESCLYHGLTFGISSAPFTLAAGTYSVRISPANTLAPCTNTPMFDSQVTLHSGASVSAVAAITGGKPTLLKFIDNLSPVASGNARFVFANAADAPALQVTLTEMNAKDATMFKITVDPGKEQGITVPEATYTVQVTPAGSNTVLATEEIGLAGQSTTLTYAAGEASNNVLNLINRTVLDVF